MNKNYKPANTAALYELVKSSGLPHGENSRSWIFTCPKCEKDKLFMFKETGRFVCWICKETEGFMGNPEYALRELLGQPLSVLRRKLYGFEEQQAQLFLDVRLKDFFGDDDDVDEDAGEMEIVAFPPDFYPIDHKFAIRGLTYLQGRGISLELAQKYGLRYCPPDRRVIIPITSSGNLYGWQGRFIEESEYMDPETGDVYRTPKIITPKGVKKENTLMFIDNLQGHEHAVVTEGPFDGMKADLCGGNVVTMGKAVSKAQIQLLLNCGLKRIYLGLDPDAGLEILRLTREFADLENYLLLPEPGKEDLGASSCEGVLASFQNAPRINNAQIFAFVERDWGVISKRILRHQRLLETRRSRTGQARRFV